VVKFSILQFTGSPLKKQRKPSSPSPNQQSIPDAIVVSSPLPPPWWRADWALGILLTLILAVAYIPAWNGQPIWDDANHLTPPKLESWDGLKQMWIPGVTTQYYPFVYTAFWIQNRIWGSTPLGYHLVNILLHAVSAFLLLKILRLLNVPGGGFAALLFALHPVQVETVAWMSELKNVLSGTLYLGSGLVYLHFYSSRRRWTLYALALGLFVLALLSKTVTASLPAALLVVLWWKNGRLAWKSDVLPLMPFFALGISMGLVTIWVEKTFVGASGSEFEFSLLERGLIAGRGIWFYLAKFIWPQNLTFIYPRWQIDAAVWWQYIFPIAVLILVIALWRLRTRSRSPLAAFFFFAGTLFPALGFIDVYPFRYSFVADHFQYLALIGPITLVAAAISSIGNRQRLIRPVCGLALVAALSILTWRQSRMYSDMETLWRTTLDRNPRAAMAHTNLGVLLLAKGEPDAAISHLETSLRIKPDDAETQNNMGLALNQKGQPDKAIPHFEEALRIKPGFAAAYGNLGTVLQEKGQWDAAARNYEKAIELRPDSPGIRFNLGVLSLQTGRLDAAESHFRAAVEADAQDAEAQYRLGSALHRKGQAAEAISQYRKAIDLKPDYKEANADLIVALLQTGQTSEVIRQFELMVNSAPDNAQTLNNLAWLLSTANPTSLRDGARAVAVAERAVQLTGNMDVNTLRTLAAAYAQNKQFDQALATARQASKLAISGSNTALAQAIERDIGFYRTGTPLH
jgi:tetratricopeptide (TPR) repeat protein